VAAKWPHDGSVFEDLPFQLHVSSYEGADVEQLISAATEPDPRLLDSVVLEATYAARDPDLLARLHSLKVPYGIDPQFIRFANTGFQKKPTLAALPYAPSRPFQPPSWGRAEELAARGAIAFAAERDADFVIAPALPILKPNLPHARAFQSAHHLAYDLTATTTGKPVVAYVGAASGVIRSPFAVYERLLDRPFAGVYVQPLRLHPRQDSVETLIAYTNFLLEGKRYGFRVVAGRAGTFGLILMALGIDAVDSGLGERETFDLGALDRERPIRDKSTRSGGRQRMVYLVPLMTSVPETAARLILRHPALRARFTCEEGECRYLDLEAQSDNPRAHFFHSRPAELAALRDCPSPELRIQHIGQRLRAAADLASNVNRVLDQDGQKTIPLDHLLRWSSVLTRIAAVLATRRDA